MTYRNAFKCHKCPENNGDKGCPAWAEVMEMEVSTGQERLVKGCVFAMMPRWMTYVIQASNRAPAAIDSMRNSICDTLMLAASNRAIMLSEGK